MLDDGRKRDIEIAFRIGAHDNELQAEAGGRPLRVAQLVFDICKIRVSQHRDRRRFGNQLMQQAQPSNATGNATAKPTAAPKDNHLACEVMAPSASSDF